MKISEKKDTHRKERIWELDFARGVAVLFMVIIHYEILRESLCGAEVNWIPFTKFVQEKGGAFFIFLSGICASLGSRHFKRGLAVFACGMTLTGLSFWLYKSGLEDETILIRWGVLHLIGFAMIVYPLFRKWPVKLLLPLSLAAAVYGYYILETGMYVHNGMLFPLGLRTPFFVSWDYFPILPHLGTFLLGTVAGRTLYKEKKTLFPQLSGKEILIRPFCIIGRHSLEIYMIHLILLYTLFKFVI